MSLLLGTIADDFTGATDIAGLLARSGAPVSLRLGVPARDEPAGAAFEVVALKIRTEPVDEARRQAVAALDWLRAQGARHFYWKYCSTFDSTADGNIGPVAESLLQELGSTQTVYCPAFPENDRRVFMGHLFVGEQPLDESPMRDHPLTPMRDSDLCRLLAPQVAGTVGLIARPTIAGGAAAVRDGLTAAAADGQAHLIVDAVDDGDLETLAEACHHLPLLTGGSALARQLIPAYRNAGLLDLQADAVTAPRTAPGRLVLSGSCSAMTRAQVQFYAATAASLQLDPLALARDGTALEEAERWLREHPREDDKLIYATADPQAVARAQEALGRDKAGAVVEDAMAHLARSAIDRGIRRLVVAGGETSGAVVQALNIRRLDIGREIAPGVPWTYALIDGAPLALALKSGNFGDERFFHSALSVLD